MLSILITGGNGDVATILNKGLTLDYSVESPTHNEMNLLDTSLIKIYLQSKKFDVLIHTAVHDGRRTRIETYEDAYNDILMFENLMLFRDSFKMIINLDSGAIYNREEDIYIRKESDITSVPPDKYGFSKYIINNILSSYNNIFTLRIFNIFHENEEPDRFIAKCMNTLNNEIVIHQNKFFDFFYKDDFIAVVKYYLKHIEDNIILPKALNLCYNKKHTLSQVARLIIGDNIKIITNDNSCIRNYCGDGALLSNMDIQLKGLEYGLKEYKKSIVNIDIPNDISINDIYIPIPRNNVTYCDLTLRDGSHAIKHQITREMIVQHCQFAEDAGIEVVEVGHGCGNAASSILIGESLLSDSEMMTLARSHLKKTKLSCHFIPGMATIERDINLAITRGVDIFRIASHCTEASVTKTHIEYLSSKGKNVHGVLMMAATCSSETLFKEASKMKSYGAKAIIIMDSSGTFKPSDVSERIKNLTRLNIPIGFHAHNNYHLAIANSLAAIESGASIIDTTIKGFGAGAGNTPLEVIALLNDSSVINKTKLIEYCDKVKYLFPPNVKPIHLLTAKYKIASCFESHIMKACSQYNIPYVELFDVLCKHNLTAGQEDMVYKIAQEHKCNL